MDKDTRSTIERATQKARKLLEADYAEQLEGTYDVLRSGVIAEAAGTHLSKHQQLLRDKILASIAHKKAAGMKPAEAVADYLRDAAFTTLNRFVALKMLEARGLVQECVSKGDQSAGYREYCGLAQGVALLPDGSGYRLYLECIFDELSTEVKILFDRRDPASLLWPRRPALAELLEVLNGVELAGVWLEDETIGWTYQYFNHDDDREAARYDDKGKPKPPQNSRELAVRNQFFTPRYVVQFLTDNTLGRIWYEMRLGRTRLAEFCEYMVRRPGETYVPRPMKDPRDLRILDPACGSGHFLLYAFDLLVQIYEEAWTDPTVPRSTATGKTLRNDYASLDALRCAVPSLVLRHNIHGIDIDPRCVQIAQLALWMRAQRAFRDSSVARAERSRIRRANVVVAEPMPGDASLVDAFATTLDPPLLGELFKTTVGEMRLAGHLGLLLRIEVALAGTIRKARELFVARQREVTQGYLPGFAPVPKQGELDLSGIDDQRFFEEADSRIVAALQRFVGSAVGSAGVRRHLFAEDAAQGLGLVEVCERKFDVILMNPPFGESSVSATGYIEECYPTAKGELAAAFVQRAFESLQDLGAAGVLMTRTPLFLTTYSGWRNDVLLQGRRFTACADLGRGVLDATVEVTASVFAKEPASQAVPFFRGYVGGLVSPVADELLRSSAKASVPNVSYLVDTSLFASIPDSPIAYWAAPHLLSAFASFKPFQADGRQASKGAYTNDDSRFLRLWHEVPPPSIRRMRPGVESKAWVAFAKGGEYAPYFRDLDLVIKWHADGRELKAFLSEYRGARGWGYQWSAALNGHGDYFRPGVTWSRRTSTWISGRVLPPGCIFGDKGPALFTPRDTNTDVRAFIGWLNSSVVSALLALSVGKEGTFGTAEASSYEVGVVERLPFPAYEPDSNLLAAVDRLVRRRVRAASFEETSTVFAGLDLMNLDHTTAPLKHELAAEIADQRTLDTWFGRRYGLTSTEIAEVEVASRIRALDPRDPFDTGMLTPVPTPERIASVAVGVVFGRWSQAALRQPGCVDIAIANPFCELPRQPPAADALARPDEGPTVLVDDPGHARDIAASVVGVLTRVKHPVQDDLRHWIGKDFFSIHIKRYSRSRRKAPIYWQLATPSASYSVWLYYHRFSRDTLFTVQNDYAAPKLRLEEGKLESLRRETGTSAARRKELAAQEQFVDELRAFLEEIKRIAPLWNPDLDDGVLINFAPLWRLAPQHRAWQKECKDCWDSLCAGEYDWAHLAMHLWPERVVPKCQTDRSLAIAHGLEDVFWREDAPGSGKWKPRTQPTKSVEALVQERTSPAVKAALKSLLEAPVAGTGGTKRGVARRKRGGMP